MRLSLLLFLALALAAFSGCLGGDDPMDEDPVNGHDDDPDDNGAEPPQRRLEFTAEPRNGTVPINVTFTAEVLEETEFGDTFPYNGEFNFSLGFGDGGSLQGDHIDFPLEVIYEFTVAGNFTAALRVTFDDGEELEARIDLSFELPPEPGEPIQTEYSFGPSSGCAGDVLKIAGTHCISFTNGPEEAPIDGFWIALDERHWGLSLTSTANNGHNDSDCDFTDEEFTIIGNANNGLGPCEGTVPEGSAWIFLYSYASPAADQTLTFLV